ncbi:MAG: hypothetical protein ACREMW_02055 [Gemmatimonadales bacterium]
MAEEIVRRIPLAAGQPQADDRDRDAVGDDDGDVERSQRPSWRETKRPAGSAGLGNYRDSGFLG